MQVYVFDAGCNACHIIAGELPWLLSGWFGMIHVLFLLISENLTATICQRAKSEQTSLLNCKMVKLCRLLAKAV
jgi:hypothetical protein